MEMVESNEETAEVEEVQTDQESTTEVFSDKFGIPKDDRPEMLVNVKKPFGSHFTKGCKWSPDGLCVLVCCHDKKMRIFDIPSDLKQQDLESAVTMTEGELIYDYQWYPLMNSNNPDLCCLATTAQYQPIHLYDAFDGHIRGSYRCFNHLDEMVAAKSLCFDPCGEKLYAGLKNEVRIFDVAIPGRKCQVRKTFTKKEGTGLSGIISAIAINPNMDKVYALASYSRSLGVYLEPNATLLCLLNGQKGGITHVQFSPDGTKLLAGGRKDSEILMWDLRKPGELYGVLHRHVNTNQRIYFDIDPTSKYVVSGCTDGSLLMWDINTQQLVVGQEDSENEEAVIKPVWRSEELHDDCINGVSIHPWLPYLATCSGQRHYSKTPISDSESDEESVDLATDNSFKLWKFSSS